MTQGRSKPITSEERPRFREWVAAVTGRRLTSVFYRNLPGARWPDGNASEEIHEVEMDVVIGLDDGRSAAISWAMDGYIEGLGLVIERSSSPAALHDGDTDVTTTTRWRDLVGRSVDAVEGAWHVPNDGCPDTLWAVQLSLTGPTSVTIALGEVRDDIVRYQPDALVVLFHDAAARDYLSTT
jgi:hypothetical protein